MPGELHELSAAVGGLEARVEMLTKMVERNQEQATEEHRKVHDIVVATSEAVRNLAGTVKEMKSLTDDYRERRAERRGAARFGRTLLVMGGGTAGAVASKLLDWLTIKPHP